MVVIGYFTILLKFRLARKSRGSRPVNRVLSFQLITESGMADGFGGPGRCCLFRVADHGKAPRNDVIRANLSVWESHPAHHPTKLVG